MKKKASAEEARKLTKREYYFLNVLSIRECTRCLKYEWVNGNTCPQGAHIPEEETE